MIDYKYGDLFRQDSIDKQLRIEFDSGTITNEELHSENFELSESICSEAQIRFGACETSSIKFKISNIFTPLKDKWLTVTETLDGNTDVSFQLGKYKVFSDKPTADRRYRDVTAYDAMYDIISADVAVWYNQILPTAESTVTLKDFRDSFLAYFGIAQESVTLPNDSMTVAKTIEPTSLSGKNVITAICEINGCFGHIGRDGSFKYIFLQEMIKGLHPSDTLFPRDDAYPSDDMNVERISGSHYISAEYEDFLVEKINKLQIRQEEGDIGYIYGIGNNCYIVQDNFLTYGKSADELQVVAENLYSVISKVWYRPAHVEAKGNPCLEVGDGIRLRTKYEIIYTYILQRTLKGIQALRDTCNAEGKQYRQEQVNSVKDSIIQLKGKTNKLTRTVDETILEMTNMEKNLSAKIQMNAEQILLKVSKDNIISEINQTAEKITISASKIDLVGLVNANELVSKFATITTLNATKAELNELIAKRATIEQLNAVSATVSKISADYVTTSELNAVNAKFNNISAGNITSGTLSVDRLDVSGIAGSLRGYTIYCAGMEVETVFTYKNYTWIPQSINGITYLVATGGTVSSVSTDEEAEERTG